MVRASRHGSNKRGLSNSPLATPHDGGSKCRISLATEDHPRHLQRLSGGREGCRSVVGPVVRLRHYEWGCPDSEAASSLLPFLLLFSVLSLSFLGRGSAAGCMHARISDSPRDGEIRAGPVADSGVGHPNGFCCWGPRLVGAGDAPTTARIRSHPSFEATLVSHRKAQPTLTNSISEAQSTGERRERHKSKRESSSP